MYTKVVYIHATTGDFVKFWNVTVRQKWNVALDTTLFCIKWKSGT